MGMYAPRDNGKYLFAAPNGNVGRYAWAGDHIDVKILRKLGVWGPRELEMALIQSTILWAINPLGGGHWSDLDHKTFWEWVDAYELHT